MTLNKVEGVLNYVNLERYQYFSFKVNSTDEKVYGLIFHDGHSQQSRFFQSEKSRAEYIKTTVLVAFTEIVNT